MNNRDMRALLMGVALLISILSLSGAKFESEELNSYQNLADQKIEFENSKSRVASWKQ